MNLAGLGVAMITPFDSTGEVDYDALPKIVNHIINGGADYLVLMGTTAETPTLLPEEKKQLIQEIVKINQRRIPMVLGIGGNDTNGVVRQISSTDLSPFEAILSVSPYYNKPSQDGIYHHYKHISIASPKPIIVYNVPGRTGSHIGIKTFIRIAENCTNVIGIKEASGNFSHFQQLINESPNHIQIISGDDVLTLPMMLAGAVGSISVLGNAIPRKVAQIISLAQQQKGKEANTFHNQLLEMMHLIFEEGSPTGIKALMELLSLCSRTVRLPLMSASPILRSKIEQNLHEMVI